MDDLLGIDLVDCAGDNLAAIAPMVIFPASADKRVVTRYGEVTSASFARPGSATYVAASGEVKQVGADVPRVGSTGWILEDSATNTALWSNSFTAEHGHTLNDCTTSVSPTEYLLTDESGAPRYATTLTATANIGRVGRYNISVTAGTPVNWSIHVKAISGKFRFAGYDGSKAVSVLFDCATREFSSLSDPGSISSQLQYEYIGNGWFRLSVTITPTVTSSTAAASIGLGLSGNSGYISGAQFVTAPVVTSYIYTEDVAITRASEGADTSGNGLSMPLSPAMIASLSAGGEGTIIQWLNWPYPSSAVASNTPQLPILSLMDRKYDLLYLQRDEVGKFDWPKSYDGARIATSNLEFQAGPQAAIIQWSSVLGRMRVGIFNPTTDTLTWSHPTLGDGAIYRGFHPIHSSSRMRWFYGGGAYPIHVGGLRWHNSIVSDAECVRLSKEMLP